MALGDGSAASSSNLQRLEVRGRDGSGQKEVLIAWDVENASIPIGVPVEEVEKAISNAFQYLQRRKRVSFLSTLSRESFSAMLSTYGADDVDYLLHHTKLLLAPGGRKSASTHTKHLEEVESFIVRQAQGGKAPGSVLVVITGGEDYTHSIRQAMDAGMDVEVLHSPGQTSANLL
ncbi:hypothetical protein GPECTOR_15g436 [Gonium pectorale]|uniref:NYN domain-containing protein n=1 Tax=Gonium pectorale TaxID=33097 RepID=A0A150GLT4_GONPE|nr:hypothetical protein GPECTOR_15g436 [Gonium pectorale]|eukprot:KXZ50751.1 hypothetical protein GPECTOR_15g436 [Gonium pectorale]